MKKLIVIVFILAAVIVSCSQQETFNKEVNQKEYVKKESKKKDYSEPYKDNMGSNEVYHYERSIDTIKGSDEYVIVAVYRSNKGISTVIIGRLTRLD